METTGQTKASHSPEPWETGGFSIHANGVRIAELLTLSSDEEREANARLFVTAPKLLKAAKALLIEYVGAVQIQPSNRPFVRQELVDLEVAVAEAEGRA